MPRLLANLPGRDSGLGRFGDQPRPQAVRRVQVRIDGDRPKAGFKDLRHVRSAESMRSELPISIHPPENCPLRNTRTLQPSLNSYHRTRDSCRRWNCHRATALFLIGLAAPDKYNQSLFCPLQIANVQCDQLRAPERASKSHQQ
jgi:hypothetical protein